MDKLKYALNHGKLLIIILIVLVYLITSGIFDVISQVNSTENGIEILLVDVLLSKGDNNSLANEIKKATNVKYVGVATIDEKDTRDYIKTVSNYSFTDYLNDTVESKDTEIIFVTEKLLSEVYLMKNIAPLSIDGEFPENCYYNGVLYAFPLNNVFVTDYDAQVVSLQENTYAILLNGDHLKEAHNYLMNLSAEEK